jgi:hypothetical protein
MNRGARDLGITYLTNGKMAETTDEFCLVERVRCHLHPTHGRHLGVHGEELLLVDLDLQVGHLAVVGVERIIGQLDLEWVRRSRLVDGLSRVCRGLERARECASGLRDAHICVRRVSLAAFFEIKTLQSDARDDAEQPHGYGRERPLKTRPVERKRKGF